MALFLRIYYNAIFGGLGGLIGWLLFSVFVDTRWIDAAFESDFARATVQALTTGAIIGAMIGYFVVSVDAIIDRAVLRFARHAFYGVTLGAVGGALGNWIGEWVNFVLVGTTGYQERSWAPVVIVLARGLGWMVFGLAIGCSEALAARSLGKFSYGAIGGSLGGLIGGAIFGGLMLALGKDESSYTWGQAVGLVILGAAIGSLTSLVEQVLKPAALRVLRGWQEGREYPLIKPASVVGRDEAADILLLRDMKVEKRHVIIHRRGDRFILVNNQAPAQHTLVNNQPVVQACELKDGDRIQLGNVVLRFQRRAARAARPRLLA
jgi:MFS family permease